MSGYMLRLPEDESVVLSGPVARRLVEGGDGDAALLYIAVLRCRGSGDDERLRAQLHWPNDRFQHAVQTLTEQGLITQPKREVPPPPPADQRPAYTRADMARALEGQEFAGLTGAVEEKLGKKLSTPDLAILLGLYDDVGLPADVIYLLVNFCAERTAAQFGEGRKPTMRQIEKEGYAWARLGLMNQESAAAYLRQYQRSREAVPRLLQLLQLGDRRLAAAEDQYLTSWAGMGFDDEVIVLAYDKTVLKCKELKWAYMNKILCSWHQKGLHTRAEVEAGDRPARTASSAGDRPAPQAASDAARKDMARMEKYLQKLRREKEEQ